jgi:hypothetical protein
MWTLAEYRKSDARDTIAGIIENQSADAKFNTKMALEKLDKVLAKSEKPPLTGN